MNEVHLFSYTITILITLKQFYYTNYPTCKNQPYYNSNPDYNKKNN